MPQAKHLEEHVIIQAEYPLAGTLTLPKDGSDRYPAVILISGSGPVDRDENHKRLPINAMKQLSDVIASLGFATLRYDKRGVGQSGGQYLETGFWDLVHDASSAVEFLKQHSNIDSNCILLLGHSEGALIAPAVNHEHPVQGMILLSGTVESLKDTIGWQNEQLAESIGQMQGIQGFLLRLFNVKAKISKVNQRTNQLVSNSTDPVVTVQRRKLNAKWMREHYAFNVADMLPEITCPVLAITGSKDVQVHPEHAKAISELVAGPAEYHVIDNMTHILRKDTENLRFDTILKGYNKSALQPIDQELVSIIEKWLLRNYQEPERTQQ